MADFDPSEFGGYVPDAPDPVEPKLTTYYYPATPQDTRAAGLNPKIEGGVQGGAGFSDVDLREHTLEKFKNKQSDYVAVAIAGRPTGKEFPLKVGGEVVNAKNVDTGGGLRTGQVDVATSNPELARSGIEHGAGFDPTMFGGASASAPTAAAPQGATMTQNGHAVDPNYFDPQMDYSAPPATQTPKDNKDSIAGRVGSAIADAGAAYAKSVPMPQIQQINYSPPQVPASGGNIVQPIAPPPGGYFYAKAGVMPNQAMDPEFKKAVNTPMVSPEAVRSIMRSTAPMVGAGAPELLRFMESSRQGQGVMDSVTQALSGMTTPSAISQMPAFAVPGYAEATGMQQLAETPQAWREVAKAIQENGLNSREGVSALSTELLRFGGAALMIKAGRLGKGITKEMLPHEPKISPTVPPPLPTSVYESPNFNSAIANKYQPETAGLGQGSSPAAAVARGSKMAPEEISQHISDLNQGTGDIQAQTAAVRVEGARLQARSEAAGKALQAHPRDIGLQKAADDAFKDWTDFQMGPQAKLKATWARMGHELQGSVPVDLSSVNGLRQKFFNEVGKEPDAAQTKVLQKYADRVSKTEAKRVADVEELVDKASERSKSIDASDEAMAKTRENIMNRMGKKFPCRN